MTRFVVDCETLLRIAAGAAEFVALTQLQADAFAASDRDLARAVSGLVETTTGGRPVAAVSASSPHARTAAGSAPV